MLGVYVLSYFMPQEISLVGGRVCRMDAEYVRDLRYLAT